MKTQKAWQFCIDRGGTFTDVIAQCGDGTLVTHKLLSDNPAHYSDAALEGMRVVLGLDKAHAFPLEQIHSVMMGTTVATNALLERTGEPLAFVCTRGFADALQIGYQNRPQIFAMHIKQSPMLYQHVIEVDERLGVDGAVVKALDKARVTEQLENVYQQGLRTLALCLMHGYRYSAHEKAIAAIAERIGFNAVFCSHETAPLIKFVARADTTVVNAYLTPLLKRYIGQITATLPKTRLYFMQSNGGLTHAEHFEGKNSILSGPAGGIVGAVESAKLAGIDKIISFDMGGTSTDVAHYANDYEHTLNTQIGSVRLRAPMLKIHTVAAGGGSIIGFDGMRFLVGPKSAGANPGPACYRAGGPLTITDCNVHNGKILPAFFPKVFGAKGNKAIDKAHVDDLMQQLTGRINQQSAQQYTSHDVASGFLNVAVENMAKAIKEISVQRGIDIRDYALCCFGGAAGQHACLVADALDMATVFVHPLAGVLSALGIGLAPVREFREQSVEERLTPTAIDNAAQRLRALVTQCEDALIAQGIARTQLQNSQLLNIRFASADTAFSVPLSDFDSVVGAFNKTHQARFGFVRQEQDLIIETIVAEVFATKRILRQPAMNKKNPAKPVQKTALFTHGMMHNAAIYRRPDLACEQVIVGPAVVIDDNSTLIIEPDWSARTDAHGCLILTRTKPKPKHVALGTACNPIMLEVFNNLFMSIAEQMGVVLENTSASVNIKERLDFSCAIFTAKGELVANAPHMPVHLGSMGESVQALICTQGRSLREGDVYMQNSPFCGGTHLPDITVMTPVFSARNELLFFVASRGHHADVGGITPGSMPAFSQSIADEGILFDNELIVRDGQFLEDKVMTLFSQGLYPARNVVQNIRDCEAQIAANRHGVHLLREMVEKYQLPTVQAYMGHVQNNASAAMRNVLAGLKDSSFRASLDDGSVVAVALRLNANKTQLTVDFSASSAQQAGNFNAPEAICKACVLYVFRTLIKEDIPLNAGCMCPIEIIIPPHSLLKPDYPAAVCAGNVETSQVIVDALYGALGVQAAAQGTMNNFTFGDEKCQYYETICGGTGAGDGYNGASAVHSHMTNSRLTDPEILELRFPVRVEQFCIRRGSGGAGRFQGGDGALRAIRFLRPMTATILSNRRVIAPHGLQGGGAGQCGENRVLRVHGQVEVLSGCATVPMQAGDVFVIATPGGGGYGRDTV